MTHTVLTHFGACDGRFSDEQVFEVLREGEAGGQSTADLCAAHGITIPMYCVWKAKYRGLSLDELRAVRRTSVRRAQMRLAGVVVAVIGLFAAGPGVWLVAGRDAQPAQDERAAAAAPPVSVSASQVPATADVPAEPVPPPSPDVGRPPAPAPTSGPAPAPPPSPSPGYSVQVAAAQSLAEAQATVSALRDAGHEGYVLPITVGNVQHFRVRVGPFDSQREADERARALIGNGFPGAWVAR